MDLFILLNAHLHFTMHHPVWFKRLQDKTSPPQVETTSGGLFLYRKIRIEESILLRSLSYGYDQGTRK